MLSMSFRDFANVSFSVLIGSMDGIFTYIWLIIYGKCRQPYHTWMLWAMGFIF